MALNSRPFEISKIVEYHEVEEEGRRWKEMPQIVCIVNFTHNAFQIQHSRFGRTELIKHDHNRSIIKRFLDQK